MFSISSCRSLVSRQPLLGCELRGVDGDRELARGLVLVLARLVVAAGAEAERDGGEQRLPRGRESSFSVHDSGGRSLMAVSSPKAPGTYHRCRFRPPGSPPVVPAAVAGGGPPGHRILVDALAVWRSGQPEETDGQISRRQGVPARQDPLRAGREHDDPDRQDARRRGQAPVSLRRRVHRPVPLRAAALLVPDDDLDDRLRVRRARAAGGQLPHACSARSTGSAASSSSPRSASSRPS